MLKASLIAVVVGLAFATPARADRLVIPRLHVNTAIGSVADATHLANGPAYWSGSGKPGEGRTVALAGHDVTPVPGYDGHGPFHFLNRLKPGNKVYLQYHDKWHAYVVIRTKENPNWDLHIADDIGHERLILTTCWPPHEATYRYTVYLLPTGR